MRNNQLEEQFIIMIKENKEDFYRLAYSHVKNEQDALDVIAEATYKALGSLSGLRESNYMKTWFYRILINESIKILRRNKRVVYDTQYIEAAEERAVDRDELMDLYHAIDKLPDKYKTIIILKYLKEMQIDEIAEVLKMNNNTVKTRLRRGVDQLKLLMGGHMHGRQVETFK